MPRLTQVGELREVVTTRVLELGLLPEGITQPGDHVRIRCKGVCPVSFA